MLRVASVAILAETWDLNGHMGGGWWIVMMFGMVFFWAAVIIGIVWLARGSFAGWPGGRSETPLDILDRRFAAGDISAEEYRQRRDVLLGGGGRG